MAKKIHVAEKAKIYRPKNVIPSGSTNIITDNITADSGFVVNSSTENAALAKKWVDENHL